jgi:hypothetical protein
VAGFDWPIQSVYIHTNNDYGESSLRSKSYLALPYCIQPYSRLHTDSGDLTMHRCFAISSIVVLAFAVAVTTMAEQNIGKPFNGKDIKDWKTKNPTKKHGWTVGVAAIDPKNPRRLVAGTGAGDLVNVTTGHGKSRDIYTTAKHGDAIITLEVMVPKGSNSGVYVHGEYEIQVLDSWGKKKLGGGDMGAIYGAAPPKVNACKKPGEWQTYEIHFRAPRFTDGKKTANAKFLKVILNGQTLHENVEMKGPTPAGVTGKEHATGPLMFQGDHGPVAYRNIKISPLP